MAEEDKAVEAVEEEGEAIRVFVRIRPLNKREIASECKIYWNMNETSMIEETQNGQRLYAYDAVFGMASENQVVYNMVGKPIVLKSMEGFNGTVFTYGQTGSGKTWTMRGSPSDPGMMILCIRDILDWTHTHTDVNYKLTVAYMEVYNEEINDLLGDGGPDSKNLKIVSEDNIRGAVIGNLQEDVVTTHEDFLEVLRKGEANRSYASTSMNADSSRSHVIYRVTIEAYEKEEVSTNSMGFSMAKKAAEPIRISYLNLVDLAGSERQKSTNASGKTLKEGANINKSLLALGAVINKLGEASNKKSKKKGEKEAFIPYRDSKLTRILKQSLGGNTMTSILCAASPADDSREETVSTLKFGQLCKTIKNAAKSNEIIDDKTLMKNLKAEVAKLKEENEELKAGSSGGGGELISKLKSEKKELEERLLTLEQMMMDGVGGGGGGFDSTSSSVGNTSSSDGSSSNSEGQASTDTPVKKPMPPSTSTSTLSLYAQLKEAREALSSTNEKLSECQRRLIPLEREAAEMKNFENAKEEFEEYEAHKKQEFDDEKAKIESDKNKVSIDKYDNLKKEKQIQEKESQVGSLLAYLDEQDSRLRQLMQTMKDQQANLVRSVSDLQRREELVEEWQRNHRQKEMKLHEFQQSLDDRMAELGSRDNSIIETEHKWLVQQREFSEREQRLQVALSRLANNEQALAKSEENLAKLETAHKKREHESDVKERELQVRRRELESLDSLLREKDRKISMEQRMLDEREDSVRGKEEKFRHREMDVERKVNECKLAESHIQDVIESYNTKDAELEVREKSIKTKSIKIQRIEEELNTKENELSIWENSLQALQERMHGIDQREQEILSKIDDHKVAEYEFFQVKVAGIAARHNAELADLNKVVEQQSQIVNNFQKELEKAKEEISIKNKEYDGLLAIVHSNENEAMRLKEELFSLTNRVKSESNIYESNKSGENENENQVMMNAVNLGVLPETKSFILRSQRLGNSLSATNNYIPTKYFGDKPGDPLMFSDDSECESDEETFNATFVDEVLNLDAMEGDEAGVNGNHKKTKEMRKSKKESKQFMIQMLEFQKILFNILKKYNMLPGKNEPLLDIRTSNSRRSSMVRRTSNANVVKHPSSSSSSSSSSSNIHSCAVSNLQTHSGTSNEDRKIADELYYLGNSSATDLDDYNSILAKMESKDRQERLRVEERKIDFDDILGNMPQNYSDDNAFSADYSSNNSHSGKSFGGQQDYQHAVVTDEKASNHKNSPFLRDMMARNEHLQQKNQEFVDNITTSNSKSSAKFVSAVSEVISLNRDKGASNADQSKRRVSSADHSHAAVDDAKNSFPLTKSQTNEVNDFPQFGTKSKYADLSKSSLDPPGTVKSPTVHGRKSIYLNIDDTMANGSRVTPGKKSPLAKHYSKVKHDNQTHNIIESISDFVDYGKRDDIPVARISLDMGGTKKIVNYVAKNESD